MNDVILLLIQFLYFIAFFIFIIIEKNTYGTVRTPSGVFCLLWCVVGFVANLGLYEMYTPSGLVNLTIFAGIVLFNFIFNAKSAPIPIREFLDNRDFEINIKFGIVYFCCFVSYLFLLPHMRRGISIILSEGFAYLRANASDTTLGISTAGWQNSVIDSIIRPYFMVVSVLSVVCAFSKRAETKHRIGLIVCALLGDTMIVLCTAGRATLVNYMFYFVFGFIVFYGERIFQGIWEQKKNFLFVIILAVLVLYVTNERAGGDSTASDFLETMHTYYFSGPAYLSQLLENYHDYGIGGQLLFGQATFGFITNWISSVLILFTGKSQGSLYLLGSVITNRQYRIGTNTLINAMCTGFYSFIVDWGYAGIVIGPLIIGYMSHKIFKWAYEKRDVWAYMLYIYWLYVLFRTVFKWDLINLDFSIVLMCIIFMRSPQERSTDIDS